MKQESEKETTPKNNRREKYLVLNHWRWFHFSADGNSASRRFFSNLYRANWSRQSEKFSHRGKGWCQLTVTQNAKNFLYRNASKMTAIETKSRDALIMYAVRIVFLSILTAYIISASRDFVQSLKFYRASMPEGGRDASRALRINSRVLPQSLSFCQRSGVGSFWRPALLPWRRLTGLLPFLAAYLS